MSNGDVKGALSDLLFNPQKVLNDNIIPKHIA